MKLLYPIVQVYCKGCKYIDIPCVDLRIEILPNEDINHVSYGTIMTRTWQRFKGRPGMLWIEGDVAIGPEHLQEVNDKAYKHNNAVVAVPYLLYPKSTKRKLPMWSNQGKTILGAAVPYNCSDLPPDRPAYFSLGCTYLPAPLLNKLHSSYGNWDYPCLDTRLSETARDNGIPCIATETPAIHLNYSWPN